MDVEGGSLMDEEYPPGSKAVILVRVSSIKQVEEGHSLEEQEKRSMALAKVVELEVPQEYIFRIEGESAFRIPAKGRKVYERMLKTLEEDESIVAVVTWKRDRIWRLHFEMMQFNEDMDARGIDVLYYGDAPRQDTNTPAGWLMENMLALLPEFESRLSGDRTTIGKDAAKLKGLYMWPINPKFWYGDASGPKAREVIESGEGIGLHTPNETLMELVREKDLGTSWPSLSLKYGESKNVLKTNYKMFQRCSFDPVFGDLEDESVPTHKKKGGFIIPKGSSLTSRPSLSTALTPEQKATRERAVSIIDEDRETFYAEGVPKFPTKGGLAKACGRSIETLHRWHRVGIIDLSYRWGKVFK